MKRPHFLWITDPWDSLDHSRDTTLRLAQEASLMGIKQSWCDVKTIRLEGDQVCLNAQSFQNIPTGREAHLFQLNTAEIRSPRDFTSLHYRTDPPVDQAYLHPLQILALGLRKSKSVEVVNPLEVLLSLNEKIEAAALDHLMPPTLVSSQWEVLLRFGKKEGRTVLKPLHEAQSHGIELLKWQGKTELEASCQILKQATSGFQTPVVLQKYLPGIAEGEVRLWYLDGDLLATAKKLPLHGDFRVNIDRGSQMRPYSLTRAEKAKALKISKHLKARKIRLAAVDLIDGWITDFNFTSPGLISQMESLFSENFSRKIISRLVKPFHS